MENKRSKLALVTMTVVVLLTLAAGSAAPGLAARSAEPMDGPALARPYDGGGSGA